jgi:hypothetical protein
MSTENTTQLKDESKQAQPDKIFSFKTKQFTSSVDFFNQLKNLVFVDNPNYLWSILTNKKYDESYLLNMLIYTSKSIKSTTKIDVNICHWLSAIEVSLTDFPELSKFYPEGTTHLLLRFSTLKSLWSLFAENFVNENKDVIAAQDIKLDRATYQLKDMLNVELDDSCFYITFLGNVL